MKIQTRDKRYKTPPEINSGEILVETAGYMSKDQRIKAIMAAGQRLIEARKEMYEYPDGNVPDDALPDPTGKYGQYDLADATNDMRYLDQKKAARDKAVKASQKRQEASGEAKKDDKGVNAPEE